MVFSQEGELIGKIFTENRTNITYDQIPQPLTDALIATEDVRFYEHKGIDSRSLFRVFIKTVLFRQHGSSGPDIEKTRDGSPTVGTDDNSLSKIISGIGERTRLP